MTDNDLVKLPSGLFMARYPVTQKFYREVTGKNPSYFSGDNNPVERVSWSKAVAFCETLTKQSGGSLYRLPTEDEWEYAYRAGTTTDWYNGDDESKVGDIAWFAANSGGKTHPVGQKQPNAWGLYDMAGNVWEWTTAPFKSYRVFRGGSWDYGASCTRAAFRYGSHSADRDNDIGFRVVKEPNDANA